MLTAATTATMFAMNTSVRGEVKIEMGARSGSFELERLRVDVRGGGLSGCGAAVMRS